MYFADFYTRMVDGFHGDDVENRHGSRPRGAYTEGQPGSIRLMVVLLNPGQPRDVEAVWQGTASGTALAEIIWNSSGRFLKGEFHSLTLMKLREDVSQLFDQPFSECLRQFMFSNLVRCTTVANRTPKAGAIAIGAAWLREEIGLWRPEKIVAYGNTAALGMLSHDVRVDALLPHPAAQGEWLIGSRRAERVAEVRRHLSLV